MYVLYMYIYIMCIYIYISYCNTPTDWWVHT